MNDKKCVPTLTPGFLASQLGKLVRVTLYRAECVLWLPSRCCDRAPSTFVDVGLLHPRLTQPRHKRTEIRTLVEYVGARVVSLLIKFCMIEYSLYSGNNRKI